jgi:hypothetical protein
VASFLKFARTQLAIAAENCKCREWKTGVLHKLFVENKKEKESEVTGAENAAGKFQAQKVIVIGKSEESWAASFCFFVIRP